VLKVVERTVVGLTGRGRQRLGCVESCVVVGPTIAESWNGVDPDLPLHPGFALNYAALGLD
jgi:hypothetical protein